MDIEAQAAAAERSLQELRQALQAAGRTKAAERTNAVAQCERLVQRLKNSLDSYRLELRSLQREEEISQHRSRLSSLEEALRQCKAQLDWKRLDAEGSGKASASASASAAEDGPPTLDQAVAAAERAQDDSQASIARSGKMLAEAEQIGIATLDKMHEQEEQMDRIGESMEDIKANIKRSKKLVSQIARSAANDRCIQMLCVLITVCIMVAIVLAITGKDGGQLNVPDPVRQIGR